MPRNQVKEQKIEMTKIRFISYIMTFIFNLLCQDLLSLASFLRFERLSVI